MKIKITFLVTFAFLCISAASRPARIGIYTIYQPDGTSFQATCHGDEFMKIKTTLDGHVIIKDEDGWWCYASFDANGSRSSSGYKVGKGEPDQAISNTGIPYGKLKEAARNKRRAGTDDSRPPFMRRLMMHDGMQTKAEGRATKHGLIILAQYSDVSFRFKKEDFMKMMTQEGYSYNGATGCAKEYFDDQFEGRVEFDFQVSDIVTLSRTRAFYGANDKYGSDKRPAEMVAEACELADKEIDFSLYDDDNDGYVDNVFVFFAGGDEAENIEMEDYIWSHAWYVYSGAGITLRLDGKMIDSYACTSELSRQDDDRENLAGIGSFCHEYSHTFGLPDFYDTDYDEEGGWAAGMWHSTSLMDGGNMNNNSNTPPYFNALERELLGLAEPIVIEHDGSYTLEPIHSSNTFYRLNTDQEGEYYLFECRANSGWDKHIGGKGMLVYHIDRSKGYEEHWYYNTVNAKVSHQCADLVEADSRTDGFKSDYDYIYGMQNISGVFFPYSSVNMLTPQSDPGIKYWSGRTGKISITGIERKGNNINFSVVGFSKDSTPPSPKDVKTETFMDAAIINFESSRPHNGEATIRWGRVGDVPEEIKIMPYEAGKYSLTLRNLIPGNKTYKVEIWFETNGVKGNKQEVTFMTTKKAPVDWPYIFLGKNATQSDGTFKAGEKIALMVYNASEAENIRWTFNGSTIKPEGDGYYRTSESGILKVFIDWEDGSQDIIEKNITIN